MELQEEFQEKPVRRFIENPLPGPKKHVKKTMDFPMIPSEDQMNFDIETKPDDDFDIQ